MQGYSTYKSMHNKRWQTRLKGFFKLNVKYINKKTIKSAKDNAVISMNPQKVMQSVG